MTKDAGSTIEGYLQLIMIGILSFVAGAFTSIAIINIISASINEMEIWDESKNREDCGLSFCSNSGDASFYSRDR